MWHWRLLFLFILIPLAELALIIEVGQIIGTWPTVAVVFGTGALGALLAQSQGWATMRRIQSEVAEGRVPASGLLHGLFVLAGGLLLLTPGLVTDAIGFCFLLPFARTLCVRWLQRRLRHWIERGTLRIYDLRQ